MNRFALLVIALSLCGIGNFAAADEPFRKWMDYFHGAWTYESSSGKKGEIAFKYAPGKYAMIGVRPDSQEGVQIVGWQPDRGMVVDTEYDEDGTYSVIEYAEIGEREMRGKFVHLSGPKGNFAYVMVVVKIKGDDQATSVIKGTNEKGEGLEVRNTFHRKEQADAPSLEPTGKVPAKVLEYNRHPIGNWVAEVELKGQQREVRMSVKPMPGEVGYLIHWTGPGGPGNPETQLTAIGGWDPTEQVYREMGFATNGDFFSFVYKQLSDSTFEGKGSGTYLGKAMREKVLVDRKSPEEYTWKASEIVVGDERLPDEVYYFRRVDDTQEKR